MNRKGTAVWQGDLKSGKGTVSTESGVLSKAQYSFGTRFESGKGTNPEELIAAAHAGCFSMALSAELDKAGLTAEKIETIATVTLEMLEHGPTVTRIHLDLTAKIPGADKSTFYEVTNVAKANCPISRLLKTADILMDAKLEH
jgi:lipoyl-dependent peroxiredoxin